MSRITITETRYWEMDIPEEVLSDNITAEGGPLLAYLENGHWPTDAEPDQSQIKAYSETGEEIPL